MIFLFRENPSRRLKVSLFLKTYIYYCLPTFFLKTYFQVSSPTRQNCSPTCQNSKLLSHLSIFKIAGWRDGGGQAGGQVRWDHHQDREQSCVIRNVGWNTSAMSINVNVKLKYNSLKSQCFGPIWLFNAVARVAKQSCKNVPTVLTSRCYFFWPVLIFGKSTRKTVLLYPCLIPLTP